LFVQLFSTSLCPLVQNTALLHGVFHSLISAATMANSTVPKLSADDPMAGMTHSEVHYFNRQVEH
jgi:hypothetical protein